jgi:hypothetical protein
LLIGIACTHYICFRKKELSDVISNTNMKELLESCENPFQFDARLCRCNFELTELYLLLGFVRPHVADGFPPMVLENVDGQKLDLNRLSQVYNMSI